MKFNLSANNGCFEEEIEAENLDKAKNYADEYASYNQANMYIYDENYDKLLSTRQWWGTPYSPEISEDEEDEIISFGSFDYYSAWEDE